VLDQGPRFGGDFRQPGDAATRRASIGINAGQPGNDAAAEQRQPRDTVLRDCRVRVGRLEGALHGRFDRALHSAESVVVGKSEMTTCLILAIEPRQCEGEQRQAILRAARLDVHEQGVDQGILYLKRACASLKPFRWSLYHFGIGSLRHRWQAEHFLMHAHFGACLLSCEHPFDAGLGGNAPLPPGGGLGGQVFATLDATIEALDSQHADLDLHHVQPAGVLTTAVSSITGPLLDSTLYTTGEPCAMCVGAILWCRFGQLVFAASIQQVATTRDQIMISSADRVLARARKVSRASRPRSLRVQGVRAP
jgi:hypothetical protein